MTDAELQEAEDVYRLLCRGLGHEKVTDDNVDALIRRADRDGHTILATELREWQAPCSAGRAERANITSPPTAPTPSTPPRR
jgi:hypothetical protein